MSELDVSALLSVDEAIRIIDDAEVAPRVIERPLAEAQGLILAEDLRADRDYPPFDKSLMDGFAVRCADVAAGPVELIVMGEIAAGRPSNQGLGPGQTIAIMTGAPLPIGADGVVPIEEVQQAPGGHDASIRVSQALSAGRYVAKKGADVRSGEVVLHVGARLESAQLAAAATVGAAVLKVYAAPRVAVLATGDEIIPVDAKPGPAQIRDSNSILVASLLRRMDCQFVDLGVVRDDPDLLRRAIVQGLSADALIVTGGMSMGKYDHVPRLLAELGVAMKITKLRIKPGKPFVFATADRNSVGSMLQRNGSPDAGLLENARGTCMVFGLPGNPVSGFVCTVRLVSRILARLAGGQISEPWRFGTLVEPLPPNGPREFYQPVAAEYLSTGQANVRPLIWKGSADLFTLAAAGGLMVRAENEPPLAKGAAVRFIGI